MAQNYCEQCGERLSSASLRFCERCGTPVPSAAPAPPPPAPDVLQHAPADEARPDMDDPGNARQEPDDHDMDAMVTIETDEPLSLPAHDQAPQSPNSRPRSHRGLYAAAVAAALLAAAAGTFLLMRQPSQPATSPTPEAPAPAVSEPESSATPAATTATLKLVKRVPMGGTGLRARPGVMTLSGRHLVVTHPYDNRLTLLDLDRDLAKSTIASPGGPTALASGPNADVIYTANFTSGSVSTVDLEKGRRVARAAVGSKPIWLGLTPDISKLYVINSGSGTLTVIDRQSFTPTGRISLGGFGFTAAFDAEQDAAFVPLATNDRLARVDMLGPELAGAPLVGNVPTDVVVTGGGALVTLLKSRTVVRVNTATGIADKRIKVGKGASEIALSPDGAQAAVVRTKADEVVLLDTATSSVLDRVKVGSPLKAAYTPDGKSLLVTGKQARGAVYLISPIQRSLQDTLRVGGAVADLAVTPDSTGAFVLDNKRNLVNQITISNE